ncbi:MAG: Eco57I restriction-modification methylase domain-containing protein [Syntrophaceae bacterium]|nr:Eco57I restriction-modification methylase domain-containing protein [Syntrophaceae bacterium]
MLRDNVNQHLGSLVSEKEKALYDLFATLGYEPQYDDFTYKISKWTEPQRKLIDKITLVSTCGEFYIFWVRMRREHLIRTSERTIIQKLTSEYPYNMIIFSNLNDDEWDFVNIKLAVDKESEDNKESKKRQILRRIRITETDRLYTATERIARINVPEEGISELELQLNHDQAFDVEQVTNAFFKEFKIVFNRLKSHIGDQTNDNKWAHDYTLQFMNRLIFVYFIQKKRWLGNDPEFVKSYWETYRRSNQPANTFVSKWMKVLFFEAFNQKFSHPSWLPEKYQSVLQMAPYLNGGLFKENPELDGIYPVQISDDVFSDVFKFLQSYNFTITEDSPLDVEVAVDPEMIGRIYESMTFVEGDVNKAHDNGIVYTPRIEITMMCRLALVRRLINEFGDIMYRNQFYRLLFAFSDEDKVSADQEIANINLWPQIDRFIRTLTVIDPAVGSGSFLVGMLSILTDLSRRANAQLGTHEDDFTIKKRIIGQSLYGVDVMDWAVHVCELRLWLQLVVETELKPEQLTLEPLLPNLDFKVRCGDSLVQEVGNINMSHLKLADLSAQLKGKLTRFKGEKLKFYNNEKDRQYQTEHQIERAELDIFREILAEQIKNIDHQIRSIQISIKEAGTQVSILGDEPPEQTSMLKRSYEKQIAELNQSKERLVEAYRQLKDKTDIPFVWEISFVEIFEGEKKGFDIVIGNPPYVRQELIADPSMKAEDYPEEKWRSAKRHYKEKLMRSIYLAFPDFFRFDSDTGQVKRNLNAKNDLYVYFYMHGLSLLNPKGTFSFVTSNSWLDVGYGRDLQEFLLANCPIYLIMDNQVKRTFKNADVNSVICVFGAPVSRKQKEQLRKTIPRFVMAYVPYEQILSPVVFEEIEDSTAIKSCPEYRVVPKTIDELFQNGSDPEMVKAKRIDAYTGDKWGGKYLRAPDIYYKILEKGKGKLVRLGDIAEVRFGIKTGANEFFYLDKEKIAEWGIEEEFLKPVIKSPRECKSILIDPTQLKYKIFMCHKSKDELKGTNALKYIEWGEGQGFNQRPSCSGRQKWWDLGKRDTPDYAFPCGIRETFKVFRNENILIDKRLYEIYSQEENLEQSLNSTLTVLMLEMLTRSYGGGGGPIDATVYEVESLLVIEKIKFRLLDIDRELKTISSEIGLQNCTQREQIPNPLPDRKALDDIVFDAIGLTQDERNEVYWAVCELVQNRLAKAGSV